MSKQGGKKNGSHKDGGRSQTPGSHSGSLQSHDKHHHQDAAAQIHQDKAHLNQEHAHRVPDQGQPQQHDHAGAHADAHAGAHSDAHPGAHDDAHAADAHDGAKAEHAPRSASVGYSDVTDPPNARNPSWWTDAIDSSWRKAKRQTIDAWKKTPEGDKSAAGSLSEKALALGHGASESFHKLQSWGGELEDKLRSDWKETGHEAEVAWDIVRATVKHAWERASKLAKMATTGPRAHSESHSAK